MWYRSRYNQTASDAWRYNNPVYKLMTDKLQLMLINVLLYHFLNINVSQGSVVTRLRCGRMWSDEFITQSLLSPRVKTFWKSVNICRSYGQLSTGLFFNETRCSLFTDSAAYPSPQTKECLKSRINCCWSNRSPGQTFLGLLSDFQHRLSGTRCQKHPTLCF